MKHNTLPDYNKSRPLGAPKFKIRYHINNDKLNVLSFISDLNTYSRGEEATILGFHDPVYSLDGTNVYILVGWSSSGSMVATHEEGDVVTINNNLDLYGVWAVTNIMQLANINGVLTLTGLHEDYKGNVNVLKIPEYFGGVRIKAIGTEAFKDTSINEIVIPPSITKIEHNAFDGWLGSKIRFVEQDITYKYPGLTIDHSAFFNTDNLNDITLPLRLIDFEPVLFNEMNKHIDIRIRTPKYKMAELTGFSEGELDSKISDAAANYYTRTIHWGYND